MDIYWHIQMNQPSGRKQGKIDSSQLLKEEPPVIGTGDWDNFQCNNFKGGENGLKKGDIILVREGAIPLALCTVISDYYEDDDLSQKYGQEFFRKVEILNWYEGDFRFPQTQKTLERLLNNKTGSYRFIDEYYKQTLKMKKIQKYIDLLHYKPQIILQGPPGTGKTREAKRIARILLGLAEDAPLEGNEQFKLIQFHPSYSYEDFVRGIVAKPNEESDGIVYTAENKVLAEFARKALEVSFVEPIRWEDFRDYLIKEKEKNGNVFFDKKKTIKFDFIKKYDDGEAIHVQCLEDNEWKAGENGLNLPKNFTSENLYDNFIIFKENQKKKDGYWSDIVDYFIDWAKKYKKKPYVLIIDEINRANLSAVLGELIYALEYRGEAVQSMYVIEGENNLILPPNLYIIGTMNTADRSVGHIDYAIRRRFAFVNVLPKELEKDFHKELFKAVSKLFIDNYDEYISNPDIELKRAKTLSPEFRPEDVWLGHSYFITKNTPIDIRWEYEIKPILLEYVKDGILIGEGIETTINNLINNENNAS